MHRADNVRVDARTDCALKSLALQYAEQLQGTLQPAVSTLVWEALELGNDACQVPAPVSEADKIYSPIFPSELAWKHNARRLPHHEVHKAATADAAAQARQKTAGQAVPRALHYYVAVSGSDDNAGTETEPLATLSQALRLIRFARPAVGPVSALAGWPARVTFRAGLHYFPDTVLLGPRDSFLTLEAAEGEEAVLSAGIDLTTLPFSVVSEGEFPAAHPGTGKILSAPLPAGSCVSSDCLNELFINGRRAVRARWPNVVSSETQGLWTLNATGYVSSAAAWLAPWAPATPPITVQVASPQRAPPATNFPQHQLGLGGGAAVFTPPKSFWATASPPAGDTYVVPAGLVWDPATWTNRTYAQPDTGFVHAMHGFYWGE